MRPAGVRSWGSQDGRKCAISRAEAEQLTVPRLSLSPRRAASVDQTPLSKIAEMTKLDFVDEVTTGSGAPGRRTPRLRQRAAWMYYVEGLTQSAIADAMGIGRITVVRLLSEARSMNEVRISLSRDVAELGRLEIQMQKAFDIPEVIVAPLSSPKADPRTAIAAATGEHISSILTPDMKLGLGWGETLSRVLGYVAERPAPGLAVVSLLGGITHAKVVNPAEFAWQFARMFMAECYMIAAPAIVDSAATKKTLIERCGLKRVYDLSRNLDAVLLGVGALVPKTATFYGVIREEDQKSLMRAGAIGDILFNFFDRSGRLVDHPINQRSMSISIPSIVNAKSRILAAGGAQKLDAMAGAFRLLRPTVVITDEETAKALLARGSG